MERRLVSCGVVMNLELDASRRWRERDVCVAATPSTRPRESPRVARENRGRVATASLPRRSDQSDKWNEVFRTEPGMVRPTRDNDGTFWMDYTHFLMGFSRVDVCAAPPQVNARSFGNSFPPKKAAWRVGACFYRVRGEGDAESSRACAGG